MDSAELAARVVDVLAGQVRAVVLCPGSRNASLSLALLARDDLRVHVRIDERSAAFLALGMARMERAPVAVVMTSGTAVSNCLPAVVEAAQAHVPILVCSADRPPELVGSGASQTIRQEGIFDGYARRIGLEEVCEGSVALPLDGPAHLNVPFRPPLVGEARPGSAHYRRRRPNHVDHGLVTVDLSMSTLVVAGDEAWEVEELAELPTVAEPSAYEPFRPVHPAAVRHLHPRRVVVVGHPTLHRDVMALAERAEELVVLTRTGTATNPWLRPDARIASRVAATGESPRAWLEACEAVSGLGAAAVREVLADPAHEFSGLHVAAAIADSVQDGDTVFAAASNPVRDLSLAGFPFGDVECLSPRGAAGIDGSVSQAIGVALAHEARYPERPTAPRTVALLGDLAFLHDVGGLLIGPLERRPENLQVIVANDDGGGIFEALEPGAPEFRDRFERGFGTPHGLDLSKICAAYGVEHVRVESLPELFRALAADGTRVIEARTSRAGRRRLHAALREASEVDGCGGD